MFNVKQTWICMFVAGEPRLLASSMFDYLIIDQPYRCTSYCCLHTGSLYCLARDVYEDRAARVVDNNCNHRPCLFAVLPYHTWATWAGEIRSRYTFHSLSSVSTARVGQSMMGTKAPSDSVTRLLQDTTSSTRYIRPRPGNNHRGSQTAR